MSGKESIAMRRPEDTGSILLKTNGSGDPSTGDCFRPLDIQRVLLLNPFAVSSEFKLDAV